MAKATATAAPSDGARQDPTRGEATRERIQTEALELFYRQGFRTTTMREITGACGLTPAAFYNHFASKDDLLLDIILDAFTGLNGRVTAALADAGESATAQLRALVRTMAVWHCENLHQAAVANRETQELDDAMVATVHEHLGQLRSLVEDIILTGVRTTEFVLPGKSKDTAVRLTSTAVTSFPRSISASSIDAVGADDLADMIETLVLRMVGVES